MTRLQIFQEIITRVNNQEGGVRALIPEYEEKYDYTRSKFKTDASKYNFVFDKEKNIYIQQDKESQQQLIDDTENDPEPVIKPQARQTSPRQPKEQIKENKPVKLKKKTFEIEEKLEPLLKIQAIKEGRTLNQYVNDVLKKSIEPDTREFIKN